MTDMPDRIQVHREHGNKFHGELSKVDWFNQTEYIRADIHEARVKELEAALRNILIAEDKMIWGEDTERAEALNEIVEIATAALKGSTND